MDILSQSPATFALLAANIIASLIAFSQQDFFVGNSFWIQPIRQGRQWHRMLTSGFLHVNMTHLFVNMITLYFFGPTLEYIFGTINFLLLYFVSLLGGSVWMYIEKRNDPDYRAVGASGAISGLMLAVALLFPFATIYLMFAIPIWAGVYGALFIIISFILSGRDNAMIAHGAHLGGAVAGLVITLLLKPESLGNLLQQISERLG